MCVSPFSNFDQAHNTLHLQQNKFSGGGPRLSTQIREIETRKGSSFNGQLWRSACFE